MTRRQELMEAVRNDTKLTPLVEEMIYLEGELDALRRLPKMKVHPKDPTRQKATPAARLYKEMLQQYTNIVKVLLHASGNDLTNAESPLRKWMNEHLETR